MIDNFKEQVAPFFYNSSEIMKQIEHQVYSHCRLTVWAMTMRTSQAQGCKLVVWEEVDAQPWKAGL